MRLSRLITSFLAVFGLTLPLMAAGKNGITLEQLISNHLASIGTPEARSAINSRVAQGTTRFEFVTGGAGKMDGKTTVVSEGNNFRMVMRFGNVDYKGEDLLTNGDKVQVLGTPNRSTLGTFLYAQNALIREGLFVGELSTAWPLLDPKIRSAKLSYNGLVKVNGTEFHEVKFVPKRSTDMDIRLYFDKETFRHVMTVASVSLNPQLLGGVTNTVDFMQRDSAQGSPETAQARQQPTRFKVEQRFLEFHQLDGLTLPMESVMRFTVEGQTSTERIYTTNFERVENNVPLDARNFQMK